MLTVFLAFLFFLSPSFIRENLHMTHSSYHSFKSICYPLPLSISQFFSVMLRLISIDVISPNSWSLSLSLSACEPRCGGFSRFCNFIYFLSNFHYLYINRDLKHLKFLWTWICFPSSTRIAKWTFLFRRVHEFFYEDSDSYNEQ